ARGREWVVGMQSADGGWGAFDADNASEYLNHIPFADHGALLDPPTADVTARCVGMLAQLGDTADSPPLARAVEFLRRRQDAAGRGIDYLMQRQGADGFWREPQFTATGFPRVFFLRYHGYAKFFPLWALARYRNLMQSDERCVRFGM